MGKIVSFIIQKGGCGKTTTTVNIGGYLSMKGFKVLMVDMDPQGNMTQHFGYVPEELDITIRNVLNKSVPISEAILIRDENLHIIGNNILTAADELSFLQAFSREYLLRDQLLPIVKDYDYILIDCPPSLGILSLNALCASHEMFITISPDYFPLMALKSLIETFNVVKAKLNKTLKIKGIGVTMCDARTNHTRQVIDILEKNFGSKIYPSYIRNNVALKDASGQGKTIFEYAPDSLGAKDYTALSEEFILDHISVQKKHLYYDSIFKKLEEKEQKEIMLFAINQLNAYSKDRYESGKSTETIDRSIRLARNRMLEKMFPIKESLNV